MAQQKKTYPAESKRRMVELVRAGRSPEELAKEFEPSPNTIPKWATQSDIDEGLRADGLSTGERKELRELRRKGMQLEMECALKLAGTPPAPILDQENPLEDLRGGSMRAGAGSGPATH